MILERSMNDDYLSNTYLIGDERGGTGVLIDAGGPVEPLLRAIEDNDLTLTHVLLTHHHGDHVQELDDVLERHPGVPVLAHPDEPVMGVTETIVDGDQINTGDLVIHALHTPGHTKGMLAFLVDGHLFTGDTLFQGSVGGVHAPGSTSYADLKRSVMDVILAQDPETEIHPGHTDPTSVAEELQQNAFVRVWRGEDPEGDEPCTALGKDATLVLRAPDYDGGTKCWVRWPDGADDIVPGSRVEAAH
jgi:glyoxylase-like metal-dependent hydrolase (beta-lactamase superfamily II)